MLSALLYLIIGTVLVIVTGYAILIAYAFSMAYVLVQCEKLGVPKNVAEAIVSVITAGLTLLLGAVLFVAVVTIL
jgi:hypothetical protein